MFSCFEEVCDDVLFYLFYCVCGLCLYKVVDGESEVEIEFNDFIFNLEGLFYGGMFYMFFDVVCFFVCLILLEVDKYLVLIEIYISVLCVVFKGDWVVICVCVDWFGWILVVMCVDVVVIKFDGGEKLIVIGLVIKFIISLVGV